MGTVWFATASCNRQPRKKGSGILNSICIGRHPNSGVRSELKMNWIGAALLLFLMHATLIFFYSNKSGELCLVSKHERRAVRT